MTDTLKWRRTFMEVFAELAPDQWQLEYDEEGCPGTRGDPRNCTSKFSFTCSECEKTWSSIMATASFWIPFDECKKKRHPEFSDDFLSTQMGALTVGNKERSIKDIIGNQPSIKPTIHFRLWGQKCSKCTKVFENANWPEAEIQRALESILGTVKFHIYGLGEKRTYEGQRSRMNAPHAEDLCEACKNGVKH